MTSSNRRSFLMGAVGMGSIATVPPPTGQPGALDALIARERASIRDAMATQGVEGAAVCLIHDGGPAWVEGFGVTDRVSGRPVAADTIFSIQSTSKNVTAVAILLAVQRGTLDLDAPIARYVPDFTVHSRFEAAPQAKMTLRLLLSHRAGFTHEAPVGNNYDPTFPDFEAHVRSISQTWLRYPVGERYRYSNLGFDLAGYILQLQTGMPFADWVRTALFEPLGMADSTVAPEVYERRRNRAVGHEAGHATVPLRTPLIPSGGVYVSARDMAAYAQFHLNRGRVGGKAILSEDLWREMHGFALGGDYGLGVIRSELRYGDTPFRSLGHKGGGFGFGSVFNYCPEAGLAWAALFNRPVDAAYRFGEGIMDDALAQRYGPRRPRLTAEALAPVQPTSAQLHKFVGTWIGRHGAAELEVDGAVLRFREESTSTPLQFRGPDEAIRVGSDGDVRTYRYHLARGDEPAHLECSEGEISLDYDHGPADPPGPDNPAWAPWIGRYVVRQWGVVGQAVSIERKNGWLYLGDVRLVVEPEPGLFFTCDGEAVDFRPQPPTWKNLRLERAV